MTNMTFYHPTSLHLNAHLPHHDIQFCVTKMTMLRSSIGVITQRLEVLIVKMLFSLAKKNVTFGGPWSVVTGYLYV